MTSKETILTVFSSLFVNPSYINFPSGWGALLYHFLNKLTDLDLPERFHITRISSGMGVLSVYTDSSTPEIERLIECFGVSSITTCEVCGGYVQFPYPSCQSRPYCKEHQC